MRSILLVLLVLFGLSGCALVDSRIQSDPIAPLVEDVVERHDVYAEGNAVFLAESAELMVLMGYPWLFVGALEETATPVVDRHDVWVRGDETLAPYQSRLYLRSTAILRRFWTDAVDGPSGVD